MRLVCVNGMMVYDITQKCVRGYENGAWSACLSGGGGPQPPTPATFPWETDLRFKQYFMCNYNMQESGGVTTTGNVFLWGSDSKNNIIGVVSSTSIKKSSPVYMSGTGKWGDGNAVKVQLGNGAYYVLDSNGNVWSWGSQQSGQLGDGLNTVGNKYFANATKVILPSGVTKFIDINMATGLVVLLGNDGKIYYYGLNNGTVHTTAAMIPLPLGVTSYTKFWTGKSIGSELNSLYMVGSDGQLYSTVWNKLLAGNPTAATGPAVTWGVTINKIDLPMAEVAKITKIDTEGRTVFALTNDGNIYAWGLVGYGVSSPTLYCKFSDNIGITTSGSNIYSYSPKLISLPSGETSFVDVTTGRRLSNFFLCTSGKSYTIGNTSQATGTYEDGTMNTDSSQGTQGNNYQPLYSLSAVPNLKQIYSPGYTTIASDTNGKLWVFGFDTLCMSGGAYKCMPIIPAALPLMNGNLDPNNPRPQTTN
jgi:alpha-tubulin suppressor-like RCC1 family protein